MEKLKEFPKDGRCEVDSTLLYNYLRKRNPDIKIEGRKDGGFAWNEHSYWSISGFSAKPKYYLDQLRPIIDKKGSDSDVDKPLFKIGDLVRCISVNSPVIPFGWTGRISSFYSSGKGVSVFGCCNKRIDYNVLFHILVDDLEKVVENTKEEVNNDETFVLHKSQQKEIQKGIPKGCLYHLEGYSDIKTELLLSKRRMRKISRIICYVKPNSIFPVEMLKKQLKIINTKKRKKFLLRNSL